MPRNPSPDGSTPEPFDLDAVIAEDDAKPFPFRFGGQEYVLAGQFDTVAAARFAANDLEGALAKLLGPDQWAEIQASPAVLGHKTLQKLLTAYQKHCGLAPGESAASTSS